MSRERLPGIRPWHTKGPRSGTVTNTRGAGWRQCCDLRRPLVSRAALLKARLRKCSLHSASICPPTQPPTCPAHGGRRTGPALCKVRDTERRKARRSVSEETSTRVTAAQLRVAQLRSSPWRRCERQQEAREAGRENGGLRRGAGARLLGHRNGLAAHTRGHTEPSCDQLHPRPHRHPLVQDTSTHTCVARAPCLPRVPSSLRWVLSGASTSGPPRLPLSTEPSAWPLVRFPAQQDLPKPDPSVHPLTNSPIGPAFPFLI